MKVDPKFQSTQLDIIFECSKLISNKSLENKNCVQIFQHKIQPNFFLSYEYKPAPLQAISALHSVSRKNFFQPVIIYSDRNDKIIKTLQLKILNNEPNKAIEGKKWTGSEK